MFVWLVHLVFKSLVFFLDKLSLGSSGWPHTGKPLASAPHVVEWQVLLYLLSRWMALESQHLHVCIPTSADSTSGATKLFQKIESALNMHATLSLALALAVHRASPWYKREVLWSILGLFRESPQIWAILSKALVHPYIWCLWSRRGGPGPVLPWVLKGDVGESYKPCRWHRHVLTLRITGPHSLSDLHPFWIVPPYWFAMFIIWDQHIEWLFLYLLGTLKWEEVCPRMPVY